MEMILIIDDDPSFSETLNIYLTDLNYEVYCTTDPVLGIQLFEKKRHDLVITDLKIPGMDGLQILKRIKEIDGNTQVIVMTAFDDMETTIQAIQLGAYDYIEKSAGIAKIKLVVQKAIESKKLSEHLEAVISSDNISYSNYFNLVGKSRSLNEVYKKIGKISSNRVTVLIQGESGTGKELIAKIIHYSGVTKDSPFIGVNCSALSESLLESELFGHEKGSFTGATRTKKGKFELAGEGTIFLDEVSELSLNLQVKLLRIIQEKEFERVGGEATIPMKARIITATNRNLLEFIEKGKFRDDLFYRLNVVSIDIKPLRERREDIPALVVHLLKKINMELHRNVCKVPYEVMEILQRNDWVGNVRELENVLLQAVVLSTGDVLEKDNIFIKKNNAPKSREVQQLNVEENEKQLIKSVLDKVNWNKSEACKVLGIAKNTLYNKISRYNITRDLP
jgi:two-component system response regulator AtoC